MKWLFKYKDKIKTFSGIRLQECLPQKTLIKKTIKRCTEKEKMKTEMCGIIKNGGHRNLNIS